MGSRKLRKHIRLDAHGRRLQKVHENDTCCFFLGKLMFEKNSSPAYLQFRRRNRCARLSRCPRRSPVMHVHSLDEDIARRIPPLNWISSRNLVVGIGDEWTCHRCLHIEIQLVMIAGKSIDPCANRSKSPHHVHVVDRQLILVPILTLIGPQLCPALAECPP